MFRLEISCESLRVLPADGRKTCAQSSKWHVRRGHQLVRDLRGEEAEAAFLLAVADLDRIKGRDASSLTSKVLKAAAFVRGEICSG